MKYKVGDRVRIVDGRVPGIDMSEEMSYWLGKTMTVRNVIDEYERYEMEEDGGFWIWDDEMIDGLAEPEMTAQEVLKILAEIRDCHKDRRKCEDCPLSFYKNDCVSYCASNMGVRVTDSAGLLEICRQWKADHAAPEIETADVCYIMKLLPDGSRRCVHEEDITLSPETPYGSEREAAEEILKRYCMEHEGKFVALHEVASRVKRCQVIWEDCK